MYREVFKVNPSPPPNVRLGLAYSYHKLGQTRIAHRALERTLGLQPDCVDAMVGLAVLYLNEDRVEEVRPSCRLCMPTPCPQEPAASLR